MEDITSFNEELGFRKTVPGFATKSIHYGAIPEQWKSWAVVPPIFLSSIYEIPAPEEESGYQYSRYENPTRDVLEKSLASLDNATHALTFSAGVGALSAILTTLEPGDGIISTRNLYGGSIRLFKDLARKLGVDVQYVDFEDLASFEQSLKPNTKMVYLESPTNPLMIVLDIKAIADIVHSKSEALLVVDNTFLTSYLQRPLELGADVVIYSLSKFTNGHSDVVMGAAVTNNQAFYEKLKHFQITTGVVPSPFDCYIVNRSLKTLSLRMEKHSENGFAVANFLNGHSMVEKVLHPSLKSHKNHEIALKQSYGHSGILSFYIKGSFEQSKTFFKSLKMILLSQSFGGVETNAMFPWTMMEKEGIVAGVTDNLIRLSVGIEDVKEIIQDLDQALAQVRELETSKKYQSMLINQLLI